MNFLIQFYQKYIGRRLFVKNMLTYSIISILPITILSFLISQNVEKSLLQKQNVQIDLVAYNLNNYLDQKHEIFYSLIKQVYSNRLTSPEFFDFIEKDIPNDSQAYYDGKNQFISYFNNFFNTDSTLQNVIIYKKVNSTTYILSKLFGDSYIEDSPMEPQFEDHLLLSGPTVRIHPSYYPPYSKKDLVYAISINLKMLGINRNTGILQMDYSPTGFSKEINKMIGTNSLGTFFIFTSDGKIIYDSSNQFYEKDYPYFTKLALGIHSVEINGEETLINVSQQNKFGLLVANVIPKKLIFKESNLIKKQILLIALGCIVTVILLTHLNASNFSKRIHAIITGMNLVRIGKLDSRIKTDLYGDEINTIATNFNAMCGDLSEYIKQVYIYEIRKKNAELEALQSQINPHFIYNTLEVIRMSAASQGDTQVSQMILLLAKLFRNIVKEENIVSIMTEINNSKLYLDLFQIRYSNKFSYDIQVSSSIGSLGIPKHILQPIIENYLIHGYDQKKENNHIHILFNEVAGDIVMELTDNGLGIDEERLNKIQTQLKSSDSIGRWNIGLKNVNERIKLIYGIKYGITIDSVPYKYTTVICRIASNTVQELQDRDALPSERLI